MFFPKWCSEHFLCHLVETFSLPLRGFMLESVQRTQNMIRSKMLTTRRTRKHDSKQNVNHTKNSWNLSTAESGRRINLNQPGPQALLYVEVMLQVVSSDPLATGHASCWIRCQGPGPESSESSESPKPKSSALASDPNEVRQVRLQQIRI